MGIAIDLVFKLSPDLAVSIWPEGSGVQPTLTSSNGALPTQTTAPLAPPAIKLVIATSVAVFLLNKFNFKSIHGATSVSAPGDGDASGAELSIRFVEV